MGDMGGWGLSIKSSPLCQTENVGVTALSNMQCTPRKPLITANESPDQAAQQAKLNTEKLLLTHRNIPPPTSVKWRIVISYKALESLCQLCHDTIFFFQTCESMRVAVIFCIIPFHLSFVFL
jgi:hypothetical protein